MIGNFRRHLTWISLAAIVAAGITGWLWIGRQTMPSDAIISAQTRSVGASPETARPSSLPLQPASKAVGKSADDSPEILVRVAAEIGKCRDLLNSIELSNAEVLQDTENIRIVRVRPPAKEELDTVYVALTKAADSFPSDSSAGAKFREKAIALIQEYGTYQYPGRLMTVRKEPSGEESFGVLEFADAAATVTVNAEGQIEVSSGKMSYQRGLDWNIPNSPTRIRYQHLFQNS